jgi:hypothetical protein
MEHLRGAFKANSALVAREVKETGPPAKPQRPVRNLNDQNSCKKFRQIAKFAQKTDSLPPAHTFKQPKK